MSDQAPPVSDVLWRAVLRRAPVDGTFYGVTSTRIYCRFGCPARAPLRRNLVLFRTTAAAERAGFRACKRCQPEGKRAPVAREAMAAWRAAAGERISTAFAESPFGPLLVGTTERGVCFIGFAEPDAALEDDLRRRFPRAELVRDDRALAATVRTVVAFMEAPRAAMDLPLDPRGTPFQMRVWQALRAIPPGETRCYAELAQALGHPRAARAVAGSCAANPLALAVPCHRVVGSGGDLTGYRWGLARKRTLLERERGDGDTPGQRGAGPAGDIPNAA